MPPSATYLKLVTVASITARKNELYHYDDEEGMMKFRKELADLSGPIGDLIASLVMSKQDFDSAKAQRSKELAAGKQSGSSCGGGGKAKGKGKVTL